MQLRHKTYAIHIVQYRNAGDDEIETFRITITSHRWSWVNIYKYLQVDPGSEHKMSSCSGIQAWVDDKMPGWAAVKRGTFSRVPNRSQEKRGPFEGPHEESQDRCCLYNMYNR